MLGQEMPDDSLFDQLGAVLVPLGGFAFKMRSRKTVQFPEKFRFPGIPGAQRGAAGLRVAEKHQHIETIQRPDGVREILNQGRIGQITTLRQCRH